MPKTEDPVIAMQALLRRKLQQHFDYTRAVSFSFTGKSAEQTSCYRPNRSAINGSLHDAHKRTSD